MANFWSHLLRRGSRRLQTSLLSPLFSWIFCSAHPSRWHNLTQCKLLIIKTSRPFPGKAWLHYDIAFQRDAAASGLTDWSRMNLDLYNSLFTVSDNTSLSVTNLPATCQFTSVHSVNMSHSVQASNDLLAISANAPLSTEELPAKCQVMSAHPPGFNGIPLHADKLMGPSMCLTVLGIELNSLTFRARLSQEKFDHIAALLDN
ncbi:unnamed protein product [Porites evermanni]|uniref:Uncharacterized protein n=1 Tax=Porites evermanni TaxID=104178 RepID=A0ABN8SWM0_9CNID|nr:unnamed protein product [Porites evermanni]